MNSDLQSAELFSEYYKKWVDVYNAYAGQTEPLDPDIESQ
jgi:hypothetical protein